MDGTDVPSRRCRLSIAELTREGSSLPAVGLAQLGQEVRHVNAHGLFTDKEPFGNDPVGRSRGQNVQHLALSRGEGSQLSGQGLYIRSRDAVSSSQGSDLALEPACTHVVGGLPTLEQQQARLVALPRIQERLGKAHLRA